MNEVPPMAAEKMTDPPRLFFVSGGHQEDEMSTRQFQLVAPHVRVLIGQALNFTAQPGHDVRP